MVRVWLIRHGQSESNAGLPSADWRGIPLTELGRQQAERIAEVFADPPKLIVRSPYLRAQETAQPTIARYPGAACEEWPVQEFSYLRTLDGRATTSHERAPEVRAYWEQADPQHAEPGAESFAGLLGASPASSAGSARSRPGRWRSSPTASSCVPWPGSC